MIAKGVQPDSQVFQRMIFALVRQNDIDVAEEMFKKELDLNIEPTLHTYRALVSTLRSYIFIVSITYSYTVLF